MALIGTAGHIDHGKSALVAALSGVHPHHLPEEHARGMTIALGFSFLKLPDGRRVGIVDVPGHERLVKTMVSGATGLQLALWVVDSRKGVQQQSTEHLQILDLLGVRAVIPVATKVAIATRAHVETARSQMAASLARVGIVHTAIHYVDSRAGTGIEQLKGEIGDLCASVPPPELPQPYVAIDRVFTKQGIGTVVTGTLVSGSLRKGDAVAVSSRPGKWRIRSLHVHHVRVASVEAGNRVGINLAGPRAERVRPGDVLTAPGHPYGGSAFDGYFRLAENTPSAWEDGRGLRCHLGTSQFGCRIWGLRTGDRDGFVRIQLSDRTVFYPGQRFLVRTTDPPGLVGGGYIVAIAQDRRRKFGPADHSAYVRMRQGKPWLREYVRDSPAGFVSLDGLARKWMISACQLQQQARANGLSLSSRQDGSQKEDLFVWESEFGSDALRAVRLILSYPRDGAGRVPYGRLADDLKVKPEHLRSFLKSMREWGHPDAGFLNEPSVTLDQIGIRHRSPCNTSLKNEVLTALRDHGIRPPAIKDLLRLTLADNHEVRRILAELELERKVVAISPRIFLASECMEALTSALEGLPRTEGVRVTTFGKLLGVSRKYSVPYLEYLNRVGLMKRKGDLHYLTDSA